MALGRKTGGRSRGTPNKSNAQLRDVLDRYGIVDGEDLHAKRLHELTQSTDEHVATKALTLVLAYRHGKPPDVVELGGRDGQPLAVRFVDVDA